MTHRQTEQPKHEARCFNQQQDATARQFDQWQVHTHMQATLLLKREQQRGKTISHLSHSITGAGWPSRSAVCSWRRPQGHREVAFLRGAGPTPGRAPAAGTDWICCFGFVRIGFVSSKISTRDPRRAVCLQREQIGYLGCDFSADRSRSMELHRQARHDADTAAGVQSPPVALRRSAGRTAVAELDLSYAHAQAGEGESKKEQSRSNLKQR